MPVHTIKAHGGVEV